jgi:energy-coupling factor transport system permease protein
LSFVSIGRYVAGTSVLHALDPRTKLAAVLLLTLCIVWASEPWPQGAIAFLLALGFWRAQLQPRLLGRALRGVAWLLACVALVNLAWGWVVRQSGWALGPASVQSLADLAVLLLRLLNLMLLGVLFTATTVPVDAAEAIERLLRPLSRLRIPVHEISLLLVLSLSFIPIFLDEAQALVRAHRVKVGGVRWGWRARARAVVPLLVPLFLSVQRRADELGVAMDARCYSPRRRRTSLHVSRFARRDAGVLGLCLGAALWVAATKG